MTGLIQIGVAAALAATLGFVAVNPANGQPSSVRQAASSGAADAPTTTSVAAEQRAVLARRAAMREDLTDVAAQAVAQAAQVRDQAARAKVSSSQLTSLDAVERQVDRLVTQVRAAAPTLSTAAPVPSASATPAAASTPTPSAPVGSAAPGASSPAVPPSPSASRPSSAAATSPSSSSSASQASSSRATAPAAPAPSASATPAPSSSATPAPSASAVTSTPERVDVTDAASLTAALPAVATGDDPTAAALRAAVLQLGRAVAQVDAAATQAARQATQEAAAQQAAAAAAAQKAAEKVSLQGYANGRIPESALCAPAFAPTERLRCDAAQALDALDAAYVKAFGTDLAVSGSYRSYAAQVACRAQKGDLCAVPGTSNHGLGVAVDFGGGATSFGTPTHDWLLANAPAFGWNLPAWAHADGSKPEPWHWEYSG